MIASSTDMIADLAIVIPTHGSRYEHLRNLLAYLSSYKELSGNKIYILDSGDANFDLSQYHQVCHIKVGQVTNFMEKMSYLTCVDEPYVLLVPDDDQPAVKSVLDEYCKVRRNAVDFSSIVGMTLDYQTKPFKGYRLHKPKSHDFYIKKADKSRVDSTLDILKHYTNTIFGVHRKDLLLSFSESSGLWRHPGSMAERCLTVWMQINADIIFSRNLFFFRNRTTDSVVRHDNIVPFDVAYRAKYDFGEQIDKIIDWLDAVAEGNALSLADGRSLSREIFDRHYEIKRSLPPRQRFLPKLLSKSPIKKIYVQTVEHIYKDRKHDIVTPALDNGFFSSSYRKNIPADEQLFKEDMSHHAKFLSDSLR